MASLKDYLCMKKEQSFLQRCLWTLFYCLLTSLTIFLVITLWQRLISNPTVTTLENSFYPVTDLPYPGISICNVNKISLKRAKALANQIGNSTGKKPDEILKSIHSIGQLYDFEFAGADIRELLELQSILDQMQFNMRDLAKRLITPCEELLKSCRWKQILVDCSTIFELRLSHDGYCCSFNYVKITSNLKGNSEQKEPITGVAGIENGLSVVVNNDIDDYYYTTIGTIGVNVHVFVPTDYPDKPSGSLTEIIAEANSENFLNIVPTTVRTIRDVQNYALPKRGCLFDTERPTTFRGVYSQSDCNVDCRIKSTMALCQCIPFLIPVSDASVVCTLADLICLSNYKNKWYSIAPDDEIEEYLEEEVQNSLRCKDPCYPSCASTLYEVIVDSVRIFNGNSTGKKPDEILKSIHSIGRLYDFEFAGADIRELLEFQSILDQIQFNIRDLAKRLITPCEELLKSCRWKQILVDCSTIFDLRLSHDGYCCSFNYVKITPNWEFNLMKEEDRNVSVKQSAESFMQLNPYTQIKIISVL